MRARRWFAGVASALLLASVAGVLGAVPGTTATAGASGPQLLSTGSSFAGVAISQWEGQFNELDGGDINFTVSSSVVGMNDFCNKTVDFGATDISYATQQSNCATSAVPYPFQYMPDVAGGLAFEYNLQGSNGQRITNLILNGSTLADIFTGKLKSWNAPEIQALNPNTPLPNTQITPFFRSDASGENYLLSDYLLHVDPSTVTAFQQTATVPNPGSPSAYWAQFSNGIPGGLNLDGVSGSDAASQGPAQTVGGISYVEYAYAKNVGLPVASIINAAGDPVQPQSNNVAVALTAAVLYADLTQNLDAVYTNPDPSAYPISAYSYFVAQCVPSQAAAQNFACDSSGSVTMGTSQGAEMAQFIAYVACRGQSQMAELGYSPLPANLVEDDFQAAGRLPGGTTPPAPTPQNCDNPYITGQLASVGNPTVIGQAAPTGSDNTSAAAAAAAAGAAAAAARVAASPTAGSSAAAATSGTASAAATARKKKALEPLNNPLDINSRQNQLTGVATKALSDWSPAELALWCTVFLVIILGGPLGLWLYQRRRRPGPDSVGEP